MAPYHTTYTQSIFLKQSSFVSMRAMVIKLFSFLDFVCLVFLGMQLWLIFSDSFNFSNSQAILYSSARVITFILICISWVGLFKNKVWGFKAYYAQFPFRLFLFIYSIGFITLLPEAFGSYEPFWYDWLLGFCVFFEFLRLYLTVQHHRLYHR